MLLKELQSLGLDVRVLKDNGEEVELKENIDDENLSMRSIIEGDRRYRDEENFAGAGYTAQEFRNGELVDAENMSFTSDGLGTGSESWDDAQGDSWDGAAETAGSADSDEAAFGDDSTDL